MAIAVVALALFASEQTSAQTYNDGYQFGTGVGQSFRGGNNNRNVYGGGLFSGLNRIGILDRAQTPPYFAQFPPVYYSGIVRRPYGISPFAAPPGIEPVEFRHQVIEAPPVTIRNPYINNAAPVSGPALEAESNSTDDTANKTTWTTNPFCSAFENNAVLAFLDAR